MTRTKLQLTALCVYLFFSLMSLIIVLFWKTEQHHLVVIYYVTSLDGETTQLLEMMEIRLKDDELVNQKSRQL